MSTQLLYFFLVFIITFFIYHFSHSKIRWIFLLSASVAFFLLVSGYKAFILFLAIILASFFCAIYIAKSDNEKKNKWILFLTILFVVVEFILIKTTNLLSQLTIFLSNTFIIDKSIVENVIIPLGFSYYSLIIIAYVTDVYRKVALPQTNFLKYSLFAMYFPQMTMGPIVRYNEIKDQLYSDKEISFNCIKFGIFRILWGIAKKLIIADRIAIITSNIFPNYTDYSGAYILLALMLFGFQLYIDFSSAMDIFIGASECFGIKLPENFNNPFFSKSYHEFWQRWHITFYTFFRDYIFYPVIRSNIVSSIKKHLSNKWLYNHLPFFISYFATWIVASFWHGIYFKYVIATCIIPVICLIIEDIVRPISSKLHKKLNNIFIKILDIFKTIYVFSLIYVSWAFFNSDSVSQGVEMVRKIFVEFLPEKFIFNIGVDIFDFSIIVIGILFFIFIDILKENKIDLKTKYINMPIVFRWFALSFLITLILFFGLYGPEYNPQDFLYFKF